MLTGRRPCQREELEIIDRTMKAISGIRDPEELINVYWNGVGELPPHLRLRRPLPAQRRPPTTATHNLLLPLHRRNKPLTRSKTASPA